MLAALLFAFAQESSSFAQVRNLQLSGGWSPTGAALEDVDGDGREDVIVAARQRGTEFARELQVWRSSADGAGFALAERFPLTPDVVAWAAGDVREGGGAELVLFNATGAFSWQPGAPAEKRLERIASLEFLWQLPEPDEAFHIAHTLRDVDGDGLVDLVCPGPGGFTVVAQRRPRGENGEFGVRSDVRVPEEFDQGGVWLSATPGEGASLRGKRSERALSVRIGSDNLDEDGEPIASILVQVNESVPMPQWSDWDGDGDLDLGVQTTRKLHVFTQNERGRISAAPSVSLDLPVAADRVRRFDASYSSHFVDLDGDKRADCAVFAGDKRSSDVRTQGLFFTHRATKSGPPPFGETGRPADLLVFAGFVSSPGFTDIDGDGLVDLTLRAVRPDLIDQLRSATSESIDADVYVYRNQGGRFSREPDLAWRHPIPIERFQLTAHFCGDLTGDKLSELLLRDTPEEVRVLMLRAPPRGGAWTVLDKPLWRLSIHSSADVEFVEARRGGKPRLLVIEPKQVLLVRFP